MLKLSAILRCPQCLGQLISESTSSLWCEKCERRYPIVRGIPRFVDSEQYAESFGFQWNVHRRTQYDKQEGGASERLLRCLGLTPELVRGRVVLDAGCGAGRYADVVSRWGGNVVGLDLSSAVDVAQENLGDRGITVVQGDILHPPFADKAFDIVLSIGVLHHTPDPGDAFRQLARLVKPSGYITIWVYHAYHDGTVRVKLANVYRKVTRQMPVRVLYAACYLTIPLHYVNRLPVIGALTERLWHISEGPTWRWRVLDTFDWYSPRYQSHHTYAEVWQWFEQSGLEQAKVYDPPVAMGAYKPK